MLDTTSTAPPTTPEAGAPAATRLSARALRAGALCVLVALGATACSSGGAGDDESSSDTTRVRRTTTSTQAPTTTTTLEPVPEARTDNSYRLNDDSMLEMRDNLTATAEARELVEAWAKQAWTDPVASGDFLAWDYTWSEELMFGEPAAIALAGPAEVSTAQVTTWRKDPVGTTKAAPYLCDDARAIGYLVDADWEHPDAVFDPMTIDERPGFKLGFVAPATDLGNTLGMDGFVPAVYTASGTAKRILWPVLIEIQVRADRWGDMHMFLQCALDMRAGPDGAWKIASTMPWMSGDGKPYLAYHSRDEWVDAPYAVDTRYGIIRDEVAMADTELRDWLCPESGCTQ